MRSIKIIPLLIFLYGTCASINVFPAVLKGKVTDVSTHETLVGVTVFIVKPKKYSSTDARGYYEISGLEVGAYELHTKILGYEDAKQIIKITDAEQEVVFDFNLKVKTIDIEEVRVTGKENKETVQSARNDERLASNVINIVSARTIETLPDQNVADVMQRVSGISMTKNSFGSNSHVIVRGMPSRYNSVLVDGAVMPSTSSSGRSVDLDMFGSDLVGRIEVVKAFTPDLEGDALGGTVNLKLKQAPDNAYFKVEAGTGYNDYYFNHSYLSSDHSAVAKKDFSQLYGSEYLADASQFTRKNLIVKPEKAMPDLDLSLSGGSRFFNKKLGVILAASAQSKSLANTYDYTSYYPDPNSNKSIADYWEKQVFSKKQDSYGGYVKLDYQINRNHNISLLSSLFQKNEYRVREYTDRQNENGAVNYRPIETQTETDNSGVFSTALQGEHKLLDDLTVDWTAIYAHANSNSPDFASIEEAKLGNQPPTLNYSKPVIRNWQWDVDENKSAYLNVNYKPAIFNHVFEFKIGGMGRSKFRKNYANEYFFDCPNPVNYPNPDLLTVPLTNNQNAQQKKGNAYLNPGNYRAWENVEAVYAMVTTTFGKLQVLTGLRTEFTYMRNAHNQNNVRIPIAGDTLNYHDFLPSLHLTYKFTDKQNLRFSVYKAINRQGYTEVIPYSDPRAGASSGNAKLKHATGTSYDLRYEFYPKADEVFTAGIFYKKIHNAIENIASPGSENTSFQNIALCTNYGLELVASKNFGNFGVSANYTYTHSEIRVPEHYFVIKDGQYDTTITRYETRPLVGQSPSLFNISASYQNRAWGLRLNVVYSLVGYNLVNPSTSFGKDIYQKNTNNLGFTLDQKIGKKLLVVAKVSNLLNNPNVRYIQDDGAIVEKSYNYRSYYLGLKISL